jgi:hypothetical protein
MQQCTLTFSADCSDLIHAAVSRRLMLYHSLNVSDFFSLTPSIPSLSPKISLGVRFETNVSPHSSASRTTAQSLNHDA